LLHSKFSAPGGGSQRCVGHCHQIAGAKALIASVRSVSSRGPRPTEPQHPRGKGTFEKIATALAAAEAGHSVTFGLAEAEPADGLQELIARADADLLEARATLCSRGAAVAGSPTQWPVGSRLPPDL